MTGECPPHTALTTGPLRLKISLFTPSRCISLDSRPVRCSRPWRAGERPPDCRLPGVRILSRSPSIFTLHFETQERTHGSVLRNRTPGRPGPGIRRRQGGGAAPCPGRFRAGSGRPAAPGAGGRGRRRHRGSRFGGGGDPQGLQPKPHQVPQGGHLDFGTLGDRQETHPAGHGPGRAGGIHPVGSPAGDSLRSFGGASGPPGSGGRPRQPGHPRSCWWRPARRGLRAASRPSPGPASLP